VLSVFILISGILLLDAEKFCHIDHNGADYHNGAPEWPQHEYGCNADDGVVNDGAK
jgi:hypothetical protein